MKKLDLNIYGVQEMSALEIKENNGGWIFAFIAGAIVGGMIYEVTRDVYLWARDGYIEESEKGTYEGMPSPSFRH
jgi:hypothetical protein